MLLPLGVAQQQNFGAGASPDYWSDVLLAYDFESGNERDDSVGTTNGYLGTIGTSLTAKSDGTNYPGNFNQGYGKSTQGYLGWSGDISEFHSYAGPLTIMYWYYPNGIASGKYTNLFSLTSTDFNTKPVYMARTPSDHATPGQVYLYIMNTAAYIFGAVHTTQVWGHIAVVYDDSDDSWTLYQNNTVTGTATYALSCPASDLFRMGYNSNSNYNGWGWWAGSRAFLRALTADEISGHWNGGNGLPYLSTP